MSSSSSTVFPSAGRFSLGYDKAEVDEFMKYAKSAYEGGVSAREFSARQVRSAAFNRRRGGYDTLAVDAFMDSLEAAFVKRDRANHVAVNGEEAWMAQVAQRATALYPRLLRPAGDRFRSPAKGKGYRKEEVDKLMERIAEYFDKGNDLNADELRTVTFPAARKTKAYEEGVVDAFLARTIEILLAVE